MMGQAARALGLAVFALLVAPSVGAEDRDPLIVQFRTQALAEIASPLRRETGLSSMATDLVDLYGQQGQCTAR